MEYTAQQYALMESLKSGLIYDDQAPEIQDILRYLQDQGSAQPKSYIEDGYYELSEDGKRIL